MEGDDTESSFFSDIAPAAKKRYCHTAAGERRRIHCDWGFYRYLEEGKR